MTWLLTFLAVKASELGSLAIELTFVLAAATVLVAFSRGLGLKRCRKAIRVLLSAKVWRSRSALLDYQYMMLNVFLFPIILGFAIFGSREVAAFLTTYLPASEHQAAWLSETQSRIVVTVILFLALEFAYWLDHYLSHKVPMLWEFHKVHHTAEVLTPLTNYRVHPLDTLFFYNIKSIIIGIVYCVAIFVLDCGPISTWDGTVVVVYMWIYGHLQHSQIWISFSGWLGRIVFSPAHHQIHHSKAEIHHNTNFGMSLAVFDWMFGTLHVPTREKQRLEFGIARDPHEHRFGASLAEPMVRAYRRFFPKRRIRGGSAPSGDAGGLAMDRGRIEVASTSPGLV